MGTDKRHLHSSKKQEILIRIRIPYICTFIMFSYSLQLSYRKKKQMEFLQQHLITLLFYVKDTFSAPLYFDAFMTQFW